MHSELSIWGDIANIVIAVVSVVTAIVTAIVLIKQRKDNIKEKQPRFTFSTQKGFLIIRGEQEKCLQIEGVEVHRCIEVWSRDKKIQIKKVIPIKCSRFACIKQDENGQYASVYIDGIQNVQIAYKFQPKEREFDVRSYNYRELNLLHIHYIDIHMRHCVQYFVNRTISSKKEHEQILKLAAKVSKEPLAVSEIDLKTILEIT